MHSTSCAANKENVKPAATECKSCNFHALLPARSLRQQHVMGRFDVQKSRGLLTHSRETTNRPQVSSKHTQHDSQAIRKEHLTLAAQRVMHGRVRHLQTQLVQADRLLSISRDHIVALDTQTAGMDELRRQNAQLSSVLQDYLQVCAEGFACLDDHPILTQVQSPTSDNQDTPALSLAHWTPQNLKAGLVTLCGEVLLLKRQARTALRLYSQRHHPWTSGSIGNFHVRRQLLSMAFGMWRVRLRWRRQRTVLVQRLCIVNAQRRLSSVTDQLHRLRPRRQQNIAEYGTLTHDLGHTPQLTDFGRVGISTDFAHSVAASPQTHITTTTMLPKCPAVLIPVSNLRPRQTLYALFHRWRWLFVRRRRLAHTADAVTRRHIISTRQTFFSRWRRALREKQAVRAQHRQALLHTSEIRRLKQSHAFRILCGVGYRAALRRVCLLWHKWRIYCVRACSVHESRRRALQICICRFLRRHARCSFVRWRNSCVADRETENRVIRQRVVLSRVLERHVRSVRIAMRRAVHKWQVHTTRDAHGQSMQAASSRHQQQVDQLKTVTARQDEHIIRLQAELGASQQAEAEHSTRCAETQSSLSQLTANCERQQRELESSIAELERRNEAQATRIHGLLEYQRALEKALVDTRGLLQTQDRQRALAMAYVSASPTMSSNTLYDQDTRD